MNKYNNKSKGRQVFAAQQMLNASHPGAVTPTVLTHDDIAQRAHALYLEKGCQQGQSEQDWLQAEQELKNRQHWLQAGPGGKDQEQTGYPADY
jgi:hypothetical protein